MHPQGRNARGGGLALACAAARSSLLPYAPSVRKETIAHARAIAGLGRSTLTTDISWLPTSGRKVLDACPSGPDLSEEVAVSPPSHAAIG